MAENENKETNKISDKFNAFIDKHGKKKCIIIGASSLVALTALIVGLSVGLTVGKGKIVVTGSTPVFNADKSKCSYGIYPQTYVSDAKTLSALNKLTKTEDNGWYLYDGYYYAKATANVDYKEWVYKFSDGTLIKDGDTYWFRCDLIEWNVIKTDNNKYTLLCSKLLDNQVFDDETADYESVTYKTSDIRAWLNDSFYKNAFSDNEYVQTTEVDNSSISLVGSDTSVECENTFDKVYLLTYQDYLNPDYGFSSSKDSDSSRVFKPTDYAIAIGATCKTSMLEEDFKCEGRAYTRTISNQYRSTLAPCWIDYTGTIETHYNSWYRKGTCVQPAITITETK